MQTHQRLFHGRMSRTSSVTNDLAQPQFYLLPMLAIVAIVRPAHELIVPQILVTQPLLQRSKVFAQRRSVQTSFADCFLQRLLPRLLGAVFHDATQNSTSCGLPVNVAFVQRPVRVSGPELMRFTAEGPMDLELQNGGDEVTVFGVLTIALFIV